MQFSHKRTTKGVNLENIIPKFSNGLLSRYSEIDYSKSKIKRTNHLVTIYD